MRVYFKAAAMAVICFLLITVVYSTTADAESDRDDIAAPLYTAEEMEWIRTASTIRVTIIEGTAPLQFFDEKGKPSGVAVGWLERIAAVSGLKLTYSRADSIKTLEHMAHTGETDIICSLPEQHAKRFTQYPMSDVFLTSKTVTVVNNNVDAEDLSNKRCASIIDSSLPSGVSPNNVIFFPSRVNCLMAVDSGKADYCYSNEFSIAYYTVRKNLKNLTTIPLRHELRKYRFVYVYDNDIFVSIMNKTMAAIPPSEMQGVILESMSKISPEISLSTIFDIYGIEIATFVFAIILLAVAIFTRRILQKKNRESEAFEERAMRDSLTGLFNFAASKALISSRLAAMGEHETGAFIMIDIDRFKEINDSLGHYEGDQAITAFAEAMTLAFRKSDIKGRLGGDEFCIYMDTGEEEAVKYCCDRLRAIITQIADDRGKTRITFSAGIAIFRKGHTFDKLYKIADGALYDVKKSGKDSYRFAKQ